MKTLTYTVNLTFEDNLNGDDEIVEVANNIADAILHEADTRGIAPEKSDTFLTKISITNPFLPEIKIETTLI